MGSLGETPSVPVSGASAQRRTALAPDDGSWVPSPRRRGPCLAQEVACVIPVRPAGPLRPSCGLAFFPRGRLLPGPHPRCPGPPQDGARHGRVERGRSQRGAGRGCRGVRATRDRGFGQQLCPHCRLPASWSFCAVAGAGRPCWSHLHMLANVPGVMGTVSAVTLLVWRGTALLGGGGPRRGRFPVGQWVLAVSPPRGWRSASRQPGAGPGPARICTRSGPGVPEPRSRRFGLQGPHPQKAQPPLRPRLSGGLWVPGGPAGARCLSPWAAWQGARA